MGKWKFQKLKILHARNRRLEGALVKLWTRDLVLKRSFSYLCWKNNSESQRIENILLSRCTVQESSLGWYKKKRPIREIGLRGGITMSKKWGDVTSEGCSPALGISLYTLYHRFWQKNWHFRKKFHNLLYNIMDIQKQ